MIKIENVQTVGWEAAIRGMRNPLNSWDKSDSYHEYHPSEELRVRDNFIIGDNDRSLMMKLRNAGTDHRKFMRMIVCYCDITAPLYWWKEADTYRSGVEKNSCSTMHKIAEKEFALDDFSHDRTLSACLMSDDNFAKDGFEYSCLAILNSTIDQLNLCREMYIETKNKTWWWQLIQLLPSSYNQRRTCMISYEALANMYRARKNHKLDEWREFCKWVEALPYAELITGEEK